MKKHFLIFLLIVVLTIPSFFRMLRPGIYSMQDPHIFRLFEFDRCVKDYQLPCRWAPDSGLGYGEPMFNFYTQAPFVLGETFHLLGLQIIDSMKVLFALSLVASGLGMYLLSLQVWRNKYAALISSVLYVYGPYRALDVWVRAALPEALALAIFPLVIYFAMNFIRERKNKTLAFFSLSLALLIVTHNLSLLMFSLFSVPWIVHVAIMEKRKKALVSLIFGSIFSVGLSAFYLLPAISEAKFINLSSTTQGYFDFRAHFATISQLLFSRFWGYGASLFGPVDDLGLSVGQVHWVLPLVGIALLLFLKKREAKDAAILTLIGWVALFLTHNKSTFIWENINSLAYLQFPWRWLGVATFAFSLAGGAVALLPKVTAQKIVTVVAVLMAISTNVSFFREDIWYSITDKEQFTGQKWETQIASSLGDYWPNFGKALPKVEAGGKPVIRGEGEVDAERVYQKSNKMAYNLKLSKSSEVEFPVTYFPGWILKVDGTRYPVRPSSDLGLITANLPETNSQNVILEFTNTPVRTLGNTLSLVTLSLGGGFFLITRKQ